jgi:hypothetical protein
MIGISGLRGIVGKTLTSPIAADGGCAFGTFCEKQRTWRDPPGETKPSASMGGGFSTQR